jgi:hypothetical protein
MMAEKDPAGNEKLTGIPAPPGSKRPVAALDVELGERFLQGKLDGGRFFRQQLLAHRLFGGLDRFFHR